MLTLEKIKQFVNDNQNRLIISAVFILIAIIGFSLGFIAGRLSFQEPITVNQADISQLFFNDDRSKNFVASRNGEYYYPKNCSPAVNLKPENRLEFLSKEEAEDFGFKQSSRCDY